MPEMRKILYCPVTPAQQQFGLYITCAGYESTGPGEAYPHENHPSDYYFTWKNGRIFTDLEYQLALRKRRAMNLLVNSRLPIAQIARETGFRSPAYFAKFFHEKTGLSPTDFRAKGHNPEHLTS